MCPTCQCQCEPEAADVVVRVEGQISTIFEGPVTTTRHRVSTRAGGTHHCNGLNGDTNRCTGATCTGALDDACKTSALSFDATFSESFDDFFITRIGSETPGTNQFWAICLNNRPISVGGCQQIVQQGDEVLFAFAISGPPANRTVNFLRLHGPLSSPAGNVTLTVTDGKGVPIQGARISGSSNPPPIPLPQTDVNGKATISFTAAGVYRLKADKNDHLVSIRSNQLALVIN